jgi:hypothetical protein
MKKTSNYEILSRIRRSWGQVNPATKVFKSKKAYDRKDKSWKNQD